jgi:hypothetical protein
MQLLAQFVQNPKRRGHRRPRFCRRLAGHYPVSSPGESHPEALSEPCLNVSAHTAPARESTPRMIGLNIRDRSSIDLSLRECRFQLRISARIAVCCLRRDMSGSALLNTFRLIV